MMWVLMCCIAIAVGFILYGSIQDQLPKELQLPKSNVSSQHGTAHPAQANGASVSVPKVYVSKWQVRSDGNNVEVTRDFDGSIAQNGQRYDAPSLVLTCYEGQLFASVNLRMAPKLTQNKGSVTSAQGPQLWNAGQGHDLYSPTPRVIVDAVAREKPFQLVLPYAELGPQSVTFTPKDGAKALQALPAACR